MSDCYHHDGNCVGFIVSGQKYLELCQDCGKYYCKTHFNHRHKCIVSSCWSASDSSGYCSAHACRTVQRDRNGNIVYRPSG
jgi:hypothetical protein